MISYGGKMKKHLLLISTFLFVFLNTSLFAEQYLGASLHLNYYREAQETTDATFCEQLAGFGLGFSYGYYFGDEAAFGLLLDANLNFPIWHNYKENGTLYANWVDKESTSFMFEIYPSLSFRAPLGGSLLILKAFPYYSLYLFDVSTTSYKSVTSDSFVKANIHLENFKSSLGAGGEIFFSSNPMDSGVFLNFKYSVTTKNTNFFKNMSVYKPNFQITLGFRVGILPTSDSSSGTTKKSDGTDYADTTAQDTADSDDKKDTDSTTTETTTDTTTNTNGTTTSGEGDSDPYPGATDKLPEPKPFE